MASAAKRIVSTSNNSDAEKIIGFSAEDLKAPFVLRCAALFIDYMVVLTLPVTWLVVGRFFAETGSGVSIGAGIWFFAFLLFLVNFMVLPIFRGQSLGKIIVGLTIVRTDGSDINLVVIVRRHILGYLATILTLGIGFLISALNTSGRSLHDLIGGTVVIRGRKTQV